MDKQPKTPPIVVCPPYFTTPEVIAAWAPIAAYYGATWGAGGYTVPAKTAPAFCEALDTLARAVADASYTRSQEARS